MAVAGSTSLVAAMAGLRTSPIDDGNLNRSFPGDPNGTPGGTGTARAPAAPTYLQLSIGDPALDQSTCELSGQESYSVWIATTGPPEP